MGLGWDWDGTGVGLARDSYDVRIVLGMYIPDTIVALLGLPKSLTIIPQSMFCLAMQSVSGLTARH